MESFVSSYAVVSKTRFCFPSFRFARFYRNQVRLGLDDGGDGDPFYHNTHLAHRDLNGVPEGDSGVAMIELKEAHYCLKA